MRLSILIILLTSFSVFGQKKDAILWAGIGTDLGISKDFSIEFETQIRRSSNMSEYQQAYGELGASYKIVKGLEASFVYRYARKHNGDYFFNENRLSTAIRYKYKLDFGLDIQAKVRHQYSYDRLKEINGVFPNDKQVLRTSIKFSYKHKDFKLLQPYFSAEFFYPLADNDPNYNWDTYRFRGGVKVDLPKRQSVKLFYMYEHENRNTDNFNHIYCVQYNYSFRPLYKGKKKKKEEKP